MWTRPKPALRPLEKLAQSVLYCTDGLLPKGVFCMTKRPGFFAAALFAAAALSLASCGGAPSEARSSEGIHGNLHRVEYGANVAYIFGSFHLGRPHWFPLADSVENAMRRADVFAFEFDLTQMGLAAFMTMQYIMLPGGQTLAEFLPPDVYETFVANLATYYGFAYGFMNRLTPMTISTIVNLEIFAEMGLDPAYSVDTYVFDFAVRNGLPVVGLNELQSELSLALDLPDDVQIALAEATMDRAAALEMAQELRMAEMYEAQDMAGFLELRLALADADDAFSRYSLETLVHGRCRIFASEIARLLTRTEEPTTFFVTMGLLHIIGGDVDTNVLGLLREAGFEVVPAF